MSIGTTHFVRRLIVGLKYSTLGVMLALYAGSVPAQTISQSPLSIGGDVPGNLLLVPSVEWPTLDSMANLNAYDVSRTYVGYFDSAKCYKYSYNATETSRYFYPVRTTTTRTCTYTSQEWSGNYLNWAATQTIDPFRKALTGGYRVRDTSTETWVEKARYDGNGANSIYPNRRLPASGSNNTLVRGASPANWNDITIRIWQLGNKMRFTRTGDLSTSTPTAYNPAIHTTLTESVVYEVSVRVKVCDSSLGVSTLESNCVQYSEGWKPEGLIQKYSDRIRYSVFSYLNDGSVTRDGGVMRARQKFVGQYNYSPAAQPTNNSNREWDPATGVLVRNPDTADASSTTSRVGTTIADSGVINYINKFGQMTTQNHKSYDPVSELYYSAIRYLKRLGNVPEYSSLSGTSTAKYNYADGFPVITDWDDPYQYSCQNSAILGIGDVYTHRDKNLPGNTVNTDEPARPATVSSDSTINVVTATQKVAALEGITISTPFTGRENSAYIAGLAYDSHTKDLRTDLDEMQTVSTYWVDVRENQVLENRSHNQYWLATKYGGFDVPEDFAPYAATTTSLDTTWWSSGETLSTGDARPENFYVASEADKMVSSLTSAFAKIVAEASGSGSALASNSTRLDTDTLTFQAQFTGAWQGQLKAYRVLDDGTLASSPLWEAGDKLREIAWADRKIYFYNPQGSTADTRYRLLRWENLGAAQTTALNSQDVVDYLRGDRSKEQSQTNGTLRTRTGLLGDIVNSTPVYVGTPDASLHVGATFTGANSHDEYAAAKAGRTGAIYVGSNDGMLHGFSVSSNQDLRGKETYAYMPNVAILNSLRSYSDPQYQHRYFVDGEITASDVYDTSTSSWKTILVGTMGRGGPGVFALDVTDPADVKFLWEKNSTDIAALGKNLGKPVIAQVANGDWRVLLGNGPSSSAAVAQLVMIDIRTGAVTVSSTGVGTSNGLTAVLARDSNGDSFADTAYAGDLRGNLWKFTGLSGTPSVSKMFEARDPSSVAQPITAAPLAGRDPDTGTVWVFFGTGRYLATTDLTDMQVQTWYGIKDNTTTLGSRSDLVQRDIIAEGTVRGTTVRVVEDGSAGDLVGRRGWYMDLISPASGRQGERMVVPNRFQGTTLIGTTRIPQATDACNPTGTGFVMAINPFTGARLNLTFFDVSRDGVFNNDDMMMVNGQLTVVSGIGFESSPNSPIFTENVMQTSLEDGSKDTIKVQGSSADASRMSWRELVN